MSVFLSPVGGAGAQFFDNNGNPLTGGKLYTYAAGTTTPQATYTSAAGSTFHTNPIVLDAAGRVPGSSEIWLADNQIYKFVLKDSNDVLLATWDQITGVNSNFVNYTTETEVQTATAGQTVFTLTTMSYAPGTGSLTVYVDGVNQYEGDSYLETDSTTVTFTAGLHVGAQVKFTTAVQTTGNATDASVVSYTAPYTGAVPYTVQDKLAQTVSVKDFGAVGDGVTDDTAAIQAAIDTGKDVIFPDASYLITAPLQVGSQRLTGGVGSKWTNRAQSRIIVNGNHAAFINKTGFPSFVIDGFYVSYGTTTPTNAGTSSEKIAFKFVTTGGGWPEIVHIQNCTVRGAWYGYYDNTGTYLSKLTQVICRNTRTGFYKEIGTTIEFDTCASSDGIQGFNIFSVLSATLLNCAADALTIDNTTPNFSGNAFRYIPGLTIIGWDGEYNTVTNTSATTTPELIPSYMRFHNTSATVSGIATLQNSLVSYQANTGATFFMVGDNSTVQFTGFDINKEAGDLTFTGSLCPVYTIYSVNSAKTTVIGCDVKAPTGGTPTVRYSLFGTLSAYISAINSLYDNSTANINFAVNQDTATVQKLNVGIASVLSGTAAPEATVTASPGSLYLRTTGGAGTTLYVKESGTGNTGWVAK